MIPLTVSDVSMPLLDRIRRAYPNLSNSERAVADYVCEHWSQVARMSIRDIRDAVSVSDPTVYRFCQSIGFSGFKEFKISLAEQTATFRDYFSVEAAEGKSELQQLVERLLHSEKETLSATLGVLDYEALEDATEKVIGADRICLFGCSTSFDICRDLQRRLTRLGLSVFAHNEYHEAAVQLTRFSEKDLLICVTQSGTTQEVVDTAQVAVKNGVQILVITANPVSRVGRLGTLVLRTYAPELTRNRLGLTTRIAQLGVADALYMSVAHKMGDRVAELLSSSVVPKIQV